jgi:hypothetical protein
VTKSIITTGDAVGGYRMVGIPDGLGAFDNGDGTFTVLMNHELGATAGIARAHGSPGAFVSRWTIREDDLSVVKGEDLIQTVNLVTGTKAFGRLCSADLPAQSALYNAATGRGYNGRLFLDGEEVGAEGRGFAHALDGTSWELPRLGKFSWENSVASPSTGDRTVVVGLDDSTPGQVYVYVGDKTTSGSPVDKAGLTNGLLYGIKVTGFTSEPTGGIPAGTSFTLANLGNRQTSTGAALQADSVTAQVTEFNRPEDGAWDTRDPIVQEDVGNNAHIGKIWLYDPPSDSLTEIAHHDEARFLSRVRLRANGQTLLGRDPAGIR